MNKNIKIALIGCGQIAHIHYRFISKLDYRVYAVCDTSKIRAETFAQKYNIPHIFTSIDELFNTIQPDIVHILVPPHLHKTVAIECLQRGSHILIEKPICESTNDLNEIQAAAESAGKQFVVDHTRVYNPMIIALRENIDRGEYGRIIRIEYDYDDPSVIKTDNSNAPLIYAKGTPPWISKLKGGILTDLLPHPISVLLSFKPELQLDFTHGKVVNGIVSDAIIQLSDAETTALIKLSVNIRPLHNQLRVFCERATITLDLRNLYSIYSPERNLPNIISRAIDTVSNSGQMLGKFILNTFRILTGRIHTYSGLDTILLHFYNAIEKQVPVSIPFLNTEKVVSLSETILDDLLKNEPDQSFKEQQLLEQLQPQLSMEADVLVTGATGFIGNELITELINEGVSVRALCRSPESTYNIPKNCAIALGDVRNESSLITAMSGTNTVYHCAAAMQGDWAEFYESTIKGTESLLHAFSLSSAEKLIYVSSMGIIDYEKLNDGDIVDESSAVEKSPEKRGFYTRAKKEAEDLVLAFMKEHPEKSVWIIRPGLVYGKRSNNNLNNAGIKLGKLLLVFGLGSRQLGLCHVNHLAKTLVTLKSPNTDVSAKILHITDTTQPSVKDYISQHNRLCKELDLKRENVIPVYIPIIIWKCLFQIADKLLSWKNASSPDFSYKFNSNSKTLRYLNTLSQRIVPVTESTFEENLRKTLKKH